MLQGMVAAGVDVQEQGAVGVGGAGVRGRRKQGMGSAATRGAGSTGFALDLSGPCICLAVQLSACVASAVAVHHRPQWRRKWQMNSLTTQHSSAPSRH